jgi:hypothetical protein
MGKKVEVIVDHRVVHDENRLRFEYKTQGGSWMPLEEASPRSIREYEMNLLPKRDRHHTDDDEMDTCSKDPTRAVGESFVSRKSGGLLVAVYPCLHIVGIKPMYSSESLTQVVLFVWYVLGYLQGLMGVIYDFACGVLRHLRVQASKRTERSQKDNWEKLLGLQWWVDRLHFKKGHKACKDPTSKYYEPAVNPYALLLVGLMSTNTQIADRLLLYVGVFSRSGCH